MEDDVVVFGVLAARMGKGARRIRRKIVFDPERSRHAKVHDQHIAAVDIAQQVFRTARQHGQPSSGQAVGETVRKRKAQVRPVLVDLGNQSPFESGGKAALDGFDFREFGHERSGIRCHGRL